jgi:hypothetical protein
MLNGKIEASEVMRFLIALDGFDERFAGNCVRIAIPNGLMRFSAF